MLVVAWAASLLAAPGRVETLENQSGHRCCGQENNEYDDARHMAGD